MNKQQFLTLKGLKIKALGLLLISLIFTGFSTLCLAQSAAAPATSGAPAASSAAPAAAGGAQEGFGGSAVAQILMLAAFAFIFYFLVFRPQNKRQKEHRDLVTKLQKGDEVLTTGGLIGKISRIADDFFVVMIAEGIEVLVQKQAVAQALPKGTMKSLQT